MKRIIFITFTLMMICSNAYAVNLAVITSAPTMMDILILICGIGCVLGAIKIIGLVKGGKFSKCWQFLLGGFSVLILVQLLQIFNALEIIMLPEFIVPVCFILMLGLFLYGIYEAKRVLS